MRKNMFVFVASSLLVSGCHKVDGVGSVVPKNQGRFAGIGVFDAGRLWGEMSGSGPTTDPAPAKIADDEHIIVVLDSRTGEVRQCGDHSGYCVAMNPWAGAPATLPVKLKKHASDLTAEAQAEIRESKPAK